MSVLKVLLPVIAVVLLFNGLNVNALDCLCTGKACKTKNQTQITNCAADKVCYAAVIKLKDGTENIRKGCKDPADCKIKDGCPNREEGSVCYKYGCCNTSFCVAEYTLGSFFDKPSPSPSPSPGTLTPPPGTPTPSINVQVSTVQTPPIKKSPSPVLPDSPTPSPSAMSTKLVVMATSSMPAEMTKVTSKPEMQSSDMSMEKPMTSSKAEVMPTETKATMMSSSVDMPSKPSVGTVQSLVNVDIDDRPTCPNHSGRVFSLSAVVLIAIVVLCNLF